MPGDMKEIEQQREFYESARPEAVEKFIENGIRDQAEALARSGIIPGLSFITVTPGDLKDDASIGKVLSEAKIADPHFNKVDPTNPEEFVEAAETTVAIINVAKKESTDPKVKSLLQKAQDRIIEGAINLTRKALPRRNFVQLLGTTVGAAIVVNACSPAVVGPVVPIDGDTPTKSVPTETAMATPTLDPINTELSAEQRKILERADPVDMPMIVTEGSKPAEIGLPIGAKLTVMDGALVYVVINPAEEKIVVGKLNSDKNLEKADSILYELALKPEEDVKFELPVEFVMRGGPGQVCKLNGQPMPEGVITGQDLVIEMPRLTIMNNQIVKVVSTNHELLHWSEEAEAVYNDKPDALPFRICGYFSTKFKGDLFYGRVYQWQNPDKSHRYLTYVYNAKNTVVDAEEMGPWIYATYITPPNVPNKLATEIMSNNEVLTLIKEWADTDIVPSGLENRAVAGKVGWEK